MNAMPEKSQKNGIADTLILNIQDMLQHLKLMTHTFLNFLCKQLEQVITKNCGFLQKN